MARYMTLFSYTGEAAARMVQQPDDREQAAKGVIEAAGGRLECFYWMFGDHDGVAVWQAPDAATAAAVLLAVSTTGLLRSVVSHQLLDSVEIRRALELARSIEDSYEAPGGRGPWHDEYTSRG